MLPEEVTKLIGQKTGVRMFEVEKGAIKKFADAGLDAIENAVENSETTIDDKVVLPLINTIRAAFDIPDND